MDGLYRIAFSVLTRMATFEHLGARASRAGQVAGYAVLAVVAVLGALTCALAALWIFLIPYLGYVGAPLAVAALLFIIALILALCGYYASRHKTPPASTVDALAQALQTGDTASLMHDHKTVLLLFAALTGLAFVSKLTGRK